MHLSFKKPKAPSGRALQLPDRAAALLKQAEREAQIPPEEFRRDYHADLERMIDWIGPLAYYRDGEEAAGPNHLELAIHLGAECLLLLGDSSYRSWTTAGETDESEWGRWIWRRALWFGCGHLVARRRIVRPGSTHSWSPLREPARTALGGEGFGLRDSNRPLDPWALEQAIFTRIHGDPFSDSAPMLGLALADSFAVRPNLDNPFAMSLKRAARKIAKITPTPVPYWWDAAFREWAGFVPDGRTRTEDADQPPHEDPASEPEPATAEAMDPAGTTAASNNDSRHDEATAQLAWIRQAVEEAVRKHECGVNTSDGLIHGLSGRVCLVVPKFWEWVAHKAPKRWQLELGDVMGLAVEAGLVVGDENGRPRAARAVVPAADGVGVARKVKLAALRRDHGDRLAAEAGVEEASPLRLEEG